MVRSRLTSATCRRSSALFRAGIAFGAENRIIRRSKAASSSMANARGRNIALSVPRRFIGDLVHFAHRIPSVPVERRMHLAAVARAREVLEPRPSWCAVFTKAYALVAERMPELRRAYMSWPKAHLYEHP